MMDRYITQIALDRRVNTITDIEQLSHKVFLNWDTNHNYDKKK
jgi:hypothetical protein